MLDIPRYGLECMRVWMYGHLNVWMYGHMDGYVVIWLRMDVWGIII